MIINNGVDLYNKYEEINEMKKKVSTKFSKILSIPFVKKLFIPIILKDRYHSSFIFNLPVYSNTRVALSLLVKRYYIFNIVLNYV